MKKVLFSVLSLFVCGACSGGLFKNGEEPIVKEATWNPAIEKFTSCQGIDSYLQEYRQSYPIPASTARTPENAAGQAYENQVGDVLEGDILQITPSFFFYVRAKSVEIIRRKNLAHYKSIQTPGVFDQRLLVHDGQLISVGTNYRGTKVQIFDIESDFIKTYEKDFAGFVQDFRVVGSQLRLVTRDYYLTRQGAINCAQVYRPNLEDGDSLITFISQIDLGSGSYKDTTMGFMGDSDFFHMTSDELLLFKNSRGLPSHFRVVKFDRGQPRLDQVQAYEGSVKDRWSVLTKSNIIIFVSTINGGSGLENRILAYEKMRGLKYELAAETPAFGEGESVRSVRYFMDKAYVVTYRWTDPLFIFDIQDPKKMIPLGNLISPGFSTQLRELTNGMMLGLGVADSGDRVKVSLFNVLDPARPTEVQTFAWGPRSSSDAIFEPKALFVSGEKDRIIFPGAILNINDDPYNIDNSVEFMGAIVLDFNGAQLREAGRLSHRLLYDKLCGEPPSFAYLWNGKVNRAVQIRGDIFSFSSFGVMRSSARDFTTQEQVSFDRGGRDCRATNFYR